MPSGAAATRMFVYARAATPQTGDTIVRSVHEQLQASDPNLPVIFVKSLRAHHEGSAQVWILRTAAKMFLTLGLAGTFVAVIGLYGLRSYLASRRIREFGVRMAIGASPADVLKLVLRESLVVNLVVLLLACSDGSHRQHIERPHRDSWLRLRCNDGTHSNGLQIDTLKACESVVR